MNDSTKIIPRFQLPPRLYALNDNEHTRICSHCEVRKPLLSFAKKWASPIHLRAMCNDCESRSRRDHLYTRNLTEYYRKIGFVYFVLARDVSRIKIGFTRQNTVNKRIKSMRTDCPCDLTLVMAVKGTIQDEIDYHEQLWPFCHHGEWFEYNDIIKCIVQELKPYSEMHHHRLWGEFF